MARSYVLKKDMSRIRSILGKRSRLKSPWGNNLFLSSKVKEKVKKDDTPNTK
jgi:hypothetical protein